LFKSGDPTKPISVKARTGYQIKLGNVSTLWVSKLQTEIAIYTKEESIVSWSLRQSCLPKVF